MKQTSTPAYSKYQKKKKLISPHAVCKGTRTVIKSKNVYAYKIAYLKCTLNLYELTF